LQRSIATQRSHPAKGGHATIGSTRSRFNVAGINPMRSILLLALSVLSLTSFGAQAALSPDSPTVLITGSNRGIGLELARQYAERGWNVIATARRPAGDPGLEELSKIAAKHPKVAIERIDVTDTAMIRGVAEKYRNQSIDVLINNAANVEPTFAKDMEIVRTPYDKIDFDAARQDFDVNTLGPMRIAQAFMPHVLRSKQKKVVSVTSLAGSFGRPMQGAIAMNYGSSKAALNKYMTLLANAVREQGVIVALFQPVFVASKADIKNMRNAAPVEQEIAKFIKEVDKLTMERSGKITNFSTSQIDPF
jgi:NAD(P)-dependent dehydrogenase (short-subunit alcohol dehydrogenase family)